jgi:hypothetical protein
MSYGKDDSDQSQTRLFLTVTRKGAISFSMGSKIKRLGFSANVLSIGQLRLKRDGMVPVYNPNIIRGALQIEKCLRLARQGKIKGGKRHL